MNYARRRASHRHNFVSGAGGRGVIPDAAMCSASRYASKRRTSRKGFVGCSTSHPSRASPTSKRGQWAVISPPLSQSTSPGATARHADTASPHSVPGRALGCRTRVGALINGGDATPGCAQAPRLAGSRDGVPPLSWCWSARSAVFRVERAVDRQFWRGADSSIAVSFRAPARRTRSVRTHPARSAAVRNATQPG